jgi:hypothetical protein
MPAAISFAAALALCSAFGLAYYARHFTLKIKRRWKALSAGVAVAYVFVNVMPELEEHRRTVAESAVGTLLDAEKRIYLWRSPGLSRLRGSAGCSTRMRLDRMTWRRSIGWRWRDLLSTCF